MVSFGAAAQTQDAAAPTATLQATQPAQTTPAPTATIAKDVNVVATIKGQLAETKIQKRKRKQQDPILIPYRLNKKTSRIS